MGKVKTFTYRKDIFDLTPGPADGSGKGLEKQGFWAAIPPSGGIMA